MRAHWARRRQRKGRAGAGYGTRYGPSSKGEKGKGGMRRWCCIIGPERSMASRLGACARARVFLGSGNQHQPFRAAMSLQPVVPSFTPWSTAVLTPHIDGELDRFAALIGRWPVRRFRRRPAPQVASRNAEQLNMGRLDAARRNRRRARTAPAEAPMRWPWKQR